jgi:hypothetical protein
MTFSRLSHSDGDKPSRPDTETLRLLAPDALDDRLLRLPCYEPTGQSIELTVRDMLQHMLIVGSSGAGKSTLLNRIFVDLIRYRDPAGQKIGLLILDAQGDDTIERVRLMAHEAGRAEDIRVLSSTEGHYDPLGEMISFSDLDLIVSKLLSATETRNSHGENAYWAETTKSLVEAALAVLLVTEGRVTLLRALRFISDLLIADHNWPEKITCQLEKFDQAVAETQEQLSDGIKTKLDFVRAMLASWKTLDSRTRGILKTCVSLVVSPFLSAQALPYWDVNKPEQISPDEALEGKIVIVSVSGASEPEAAALITRLVKIDFYRAAQSRRVSGSEPLAGLVIDEFPLAITVGSPRWSDVTNLAILRAKKVFVIAATQGLTNLNLVVSSSQTEGLLVNFSNVVFLRSQETGHLYHFAESILGYREGPPRTHGMLAELGTLLLAGPVGNLPSLVPVCPAGALARLEPHQAYLALANGFRTLESVWLAPLFFEPIETKRIEDTDRDLMILRHADHVNVLLSATEPKDKCSHLLWQILANRSRRMRASEMMSLHKFEMAMKAQKHLVARKQLETIPACWRIACCRLSALLPAHFRIVELSNEDGRLHIQFIAWETVRIDPAAFKEIEQRWRRSIYPSRDRRPTNKDIVWLKKEFPHLLSSPKRSISRGKRMPKRGIS